jgi:putative heme-binding domain-containing protein
MSDSTLQPVSSPESASLLASISQTIPSNANFSASGPTTALFTAWWKTCLLTVICLSISVVSTSKAVGEELPFALPDGFKVDRVADDSLAHDCFCMTLDSAGRPVISGPGYIRTLVDKDNDGTYDSSIAWTSAIKQGAQGLWVEKNTLYFVADGGLWKSDDSNNDAVADRPPVRVLELPTGGEHDAHAIRRGPDGFWYLMVGNFASSISKLRTGNFEAVPRARAGTLWRISPDFTKRGVWAHGLRNCYDFDFLPDGQIVTYDSDDEREATLPWYRPTRVLALGPGSDAGWCGPAWKDDDYRITMPMSLARLGRGSPTGVAVYHHHTFPQKYHDATFVLDWTFGRVLAVYPSENLPPSERIPDRLPSEIFMQPSGSIGFAPTDICVAPDGSLLVSVGGRGTTGAIYRIHPQRSDVANPPSNPADKLAAELEKSKTPTGNISSQTAKQLAALLTAPCPWDSWSETTWRPMATGQTLDLLARFVAGQWAPEAEPTEIARWRERGAHILTRIGSRLSSDTLLKGAKSTSPSVRNAVWWLLGRGVINAPDEPKLLRELTSLNIPSATEIPDEHTPWDAHLGSSELRNRIEALGIRRWPMSNWTSLVVSDDPAGNALRRSYLWALTRTNQPPTSKQIADKLDVQAANLLFGPAKDNLDIPLLESFSSWIDSNRDQLTSRDQMECLTIMQTVLGDRRKNLPLQGDAPADSLDGYRAVHTLRMKEETRNSWAKWALYFAQQAERTGQVGVQAEAIRTMAMFEPTDPKMLEYALGQINESSHPTSDLHMLCCAAQCGSPRSEEQSMKTATALCELIQKIRGRGLYTDNQWPTRIKQLIAALLMRDQAVGAAYAAKTQTIEADDLVVIQSFSQDIQNIIRERILRDLQNTPPDQWIVPVVKFALKNNLDNLANVKPANGKLDDAKLEPELRATLIKGAAANNTRALCIDLLAANPQDEEYELYVQTLESDDRAAWNGAWKALESLPQKQTLAPEQATREFPILAKLVSACLNTSLSLPTPAVLQRTRLAANEASQPPPPSTDTWSDWEPYLSSLLNPAQRANLILPSNPVDLVGLADSIKGLQGDADRGQVLYQAKCGLCHGGQSALGPPLTGVAKRFVTLDLLRAIYEPSRDVPDRYRTMRVRTIDDEVITGLMIYNAADGVTLQGADGSIYRINADSIAEKISSNDSLMPSGLLDGKEPQDVADLLEYLKKL